MSGYIKFSVRRPRPAFGGQPPAKVAIPANVATDFSSFSSFSSVPEWFHEAEVVTRREWADALCRSLHELVSSDAPTGLGNWEGVWELVEQPSNVLLEELERFERTGSGAAREAAERAALHVVDAWREGGRRWRLLRMR
jgi:hypothetical protein